mmetsp:Transcript_9265/g.25052  ORF Transcript_9265/g.25052 Transcript_9265/m.25052 type:complete len:682 (-) Transcript_9265:53-2098(-)
MHSSNNLPLGSAPCPPLIVDGTEGSHSWLAEVAGVVVATVLVQTVDLLHFGRGEMEIKDVAILGHARRGARLGQREGVALDGPANQDLGRRLAFGSRDGADDRILQQDVVVLRHAQFDVRRCAECGKGRDAHPGLPREPHEVGLRVLWVQLDLQRGWADAARAQDLPQKLGGEVANSNLHDLAGIHQRLHGPPRGAHVVGNDDHLAIQVGPLRRVLVLDGHVFHRDWEMDEVLIDVHQLQIGERLVQRQLHVLGLVVRVPQFGRDEELMTRDQSFADGARDALANLHLVAVIAGAVQTAVPGLDCLVANVGASVVGDLPKPEHKRIVGVRWFRVQHRVGVGLFLGHSVAPDAGEDLARSDERVARMHDELILDGHDVTRLPIMQDAVVVHEIGDALQDVSRHDVHVPKAQRVLGIGIATIDPSQESRHDGIGERPLVDLVGTVLADHADGGHRFRGDADHVLVGFGVGQPLPGAAINLRELLLQLHLGGDLPGVLPGASDGRGRIILARQRADVARPVLLELVDELRVMVLRKAVDLGGIDDGRLATLLGRFLAVKEDVGWRFGRLRQLMVEWDGLIRRRLVRREDDVLAGLDGNDGARRRSADVRVVLEALIHEELPESFGVERAVVVRLAEDERLVLIHEIDEGSRIELPIVQEDGAGVPSILEQGKCRQLHDSLWMLL